MIYEICETKVKEVRSHVYHANELISKVDILLLRALVGWRTTVGIIIKE